jgi:ABC-2 type transport system permease protein
MRSVWIIARHEFLTALLRPSFIIITLLIPFLGLLSLGIAAFAGGQASAFMAEQFDPGINTIGVVDDSGLFTPIMTNHEDTFRLVQDEATARAELRDGSLDVILIFPSDYMETGHVTLISGEENFAVSLLDDSNQVRRFITDHLLRNTKDASLRERLLRPVVDATKVDVAGNPVKGQSDSNFFLDYMIPYFIAIFLAISIFSSGGFLLQGVSIEKTSRVIEIILSSVTSWQLLAGKVIGLGLLGLTRVVIWLVSAFALGQGAINLLSVSVPFIARPEILILSGVYYILGFLIFSILMGTCGALGATQQEAQQLSGIFSMIAVMPMWVGGFLFGNPNAPIARVLSWFPLTAPTMMLLRLPLGTIPIEDIIGSLVLLVLTVPLVIWLGSKLFRYGLLMYGKRPSFKQMLHIMWQA